MSQKTILVTTANGTVGSKLARILLDQGFKVNAFVRNAESSVARDLEQRGAKIFKGDFDDIPSLQRASEGIWGVFINSYPVWYTLDELRHNTNVINAAKEAGAKFGVYMSVTLTDRKNELQGIGPESMFYTYWKSKSGTEKALQEAGFDYWTILRPGAFLDNYFGPPADHLYPTLKAQHLLVSPLDPSVTVPYIIAENISRFAAASFANPDTFNRQAIDLGEEDLSFADIGKRITDTVGIPIALEYISREEAAARGISPGVTVWSDWMTELNYHVDYERLNQFPVKRVTMAEYFKNNKDAITEMLTK
ncbi:hypothetical protein BGW37DRAFT_110804 [Umbelopsis sp. PMI_123]|nr:hypothetical protein BGW37DRAFT_110804 [Umbelopsis sp. PMI_123]